MGKFKTALLLAVAALAVTASVAPAAASASVHWTMEGEPMEGSHEITLNGMISRVINGVWGYECPFTADVTIDEGNKGEVTKWEFFSDEEYGPECTGTGAYAGCKLENAPTDVPWSLEAVVKGTAPYQYYEIVVDDASFTWEYEFEGCGRYPWYFPDSEIVLTPDNSEAFSSVHIDGYPKGGWNFHGDADVTPAGVFGIAG
jgi:hypothetical protein